MKSSPNSTANPSPPVQPLGVQGPQARALQYDNPPAKLANPNIAENVDARLMAAAAQPAPPESQISKPEAEESRNQAMLLTQETIQPTDPFGNSIPVPTADEKVRMAAMALLNRMDEVASHPEFKAMFKLAMAQGVYTGAAGNWGQELKALKEALGV